MSPTSETSFSTYALPRPMTAGPPPACDYTWRSKLFKRDIKALGQKVKNKVKVFFGAPKFILDIESPVRTLDPALRGPVQNPMQNPMQISVQRPAPALLKLRHVTANRGELKQQTSIDVKEASHGIIEDTETPQAIAPPSEASMPASCVAPTSSAVTDVLDLTLSSSLTAEPSLTFCQVLRNMHQVWRAGRCDVMELTEEERANRRGIDFILKSSIHWHPSDPIHDELRGGQPAPDQEAFTRRILQHLALLGASSSLLTLVQTTTRISSMPAEIYSVAASVARLRLDSAHSAKAPPCWPAMLDQDDGIVSSSSSAPELWAAFMIALSGQSATTRIVEAILRTVCLDQNPSDLLSQLGSVHDHQARYALQDVITSKLRSRLFPDVNDLHKFNLPTCHET